MILNVYKPVGMTSFDVVAIIKKLLKAKYPNIKPKVGHAGTLDPLAEGVLVVLIGKDTKSQNEFMSKEKEYEFDFILGATSSSYDLEQPLKYSDSLEKLLNIDEIIIKKYLNDLLPVFTGEIEQTVPTYSAVKVKGKKLYKSAREGKEITELPSRPVTIKSFTINEIKKKHFTEFDKDFVVVSASIICSKGTYVRSLVHDIGQKIIPSELLGANLNNNKPVGAVLSKLVRTRIGEYKSKESAHLDQLQNLI